jgi:hypothetical protein
MKKNAPSLLFVGIFILVFSLAPNPQPAYAGSWGEAFAAAAWKFAVETAQESIQAIQLSVLKSTAYQMLTAQVEKIIGGTTASGALFISDWEEFLITMPQEQTTLYMNDFFSQTFRGKSGCDYVSVIDGGSTCAAVDEGIEYVANLPSQIEAYARSYIGGQLVEGAEQAITYTLDQFCSDPSNLFADGNWKCWTARHDPENPANDHLSFALYSEEVYQEKLQKEREIAQIQSVAYQGYKPQTSSDGTKVVTPGSLIQNIQASVTDLGNKIIAAAQHPAEFASALITSFVTSFIQKTITQGIGEINAAISEVTDEINEGISEVTREIEDELGPAVESWSLVQSSSNADWNFYYKGATKTD